MFTVFDIDGVEMQRYIEKLELVFIKHYVPNSLPLTVNSHHVQTWGQLLWNVMHYITITFQIIALYYNYNYPVFENVMNYITITSPK